MSHILSELRVYESWNNALRVAGDYLIAPSVPLLFGEIADTPYKVGIPIYKETYRSVQERKKKKTPEGNPELNLKLMNEVWPTLFTRTLLNFFQARLLGNPANVTEYQKISMEYCNLMLDLVGEFNRPRNFRHITALFFMMLKKYICTHLPGTPIDMGSTNILNVLQECRTRYMTSAVRTDKFYVDFENNTYSCGLIELMDELAAEWDVSEKCNYFILASEYLYTLTLYLYMIEFCIYSNNKRKALPSGLNPTFFDVIINQDFNVVIPQAKPTRTVTSITADSENSLPPSIRVYLKDEETGKCYPLPAHGEWIVGRKADLPLDIALETEDECISRRHAVFNLQKDVLKHFVLTIRDCKEEMNHTYVFNDVFETQETQINHKFWYRLHNGDKLLMGKSVFSVHIR